MKKKDANGLLAEGLVFCGITNNQFWDSVLINVQGGQIQSCTYIRTKDFELATNNVENIYQALESQYGKTPKRMIALQLAKEGKVRSPVYVWTNGKTNIVFCHIPLNQYKPGEIFHCMLVVASVDVPIKSVVQLADDVKQEDEGLFHQEIK